MRLIGESVRCFCPVLGWLFGSLRDVLWSGDYLDNFVKMDSCDDSQKSKCFSKLIGLTLRGTGWGRVADSVDLSKSLSFERSTYFRAATRLSATSEGDDDDKVPTAGYNWDAIRRNKQHNSPVWNRLTTIVQWLLTATQLCYIYEPT